MVQTSGMDQRFIGSQSQRHRDGLVGGDPSFVATVLGRIAWVIVGLELKNLDFDGSYENLVVG